LTQSLVCERSSQKLGCICVVEKVNHSPNLVTVQSSVQWECFFSVSHPGWPDWGNFSLLGDCFFGMFSKITEAARISGKLFFHEKVTYKFWQKIGWAAF
jgi:hypothetical protein